MTKPRKPSSGNKLRDALAKSQANEQTARQQQEQAAQDARGQSLSKWFNLVAGQIPGKLDDITHTLESGGRAQTAFSFSASEAGVVLRGTEGVDIESLPGFKKLDATCREQDVECTVTSGRHGYGRKSTAGQQYMYVSVDAEKPYQPVKAEKAQPRRPGRR